MKLPRRALAIRHSRSEKLTEKGPAGLVFRATNADQPCRALTRGRPSSPAVCPAAGREVEQGSMWRRYGGYSRSFRRRYALGS